VRGAVAERSFEASVYHHMAHATVTLEQVNAADAHLAGLQRLLAAAAASGGAAAGGPGGAPDVALMLGGAPDDVAVLAPGPP
jgi:hypothetical protein